VTVWREEGADQDRAKRVSLIGASLWIAVEGEERGSRVIKLTQGWATAPQQLGSAAELGPPNSGDRLHREDVCCTLSGDRGGAGRQVW